MRTSRSYQKLAISRGLRVAAIVAMTCLAGCVSQQASVDKLRGGYDALRTGQLDAAMTAADEVLADSPTQTLPAEAHYLRGRVYEERAIGRTTNVVGNLQNARLEYTTAMGLEHKPDLDGVIHAGLANVAFDQDDYGTAMEQWTAAYPNLKQPEAQVQTLYKLGRSAQRLGKWEEADRYFANVQQAAAGTAIAADAHKNQGIRSFAVQVATFNNAKQADAAVNDLLKQRVSAQHLIDPQNPSLHLVRVGPLRNYSEAKSMRARFAGAYPAAIIIP
jgi:tetratricopeptide (TPR) repeat protein